MQQKHVQNVIFIPTENMNADAIKFGINSNVETVN
jgi:hypothetical protein